MTVEREVLAQTAQTQRAIRSWVLTSDSTAAGRVVTLTDGTWRLYGSAIQVYAVIRQATNDTGTLQSSETAPVSGDFAAAVAGTPSAGKAYGTGKLAENNGAATGSTRGPLLVPTDITNYIEIDATPFSFLNLYLKSASATTCTLVGPWR